ncbi:MAG: Lrp/AsnC family transcriptional regulator [Candidatus Nanohaloarchaea archaeon]
MACEAFVLVNVEVGHVDDIMDELSGMDEIEFVASTAGEYDLILRVSTENLEAQHDFVTRELHGFEGVESTETHIIAKKIEK